MSNKYAISFDTKTHADQAMIKYVTVTIGHDILGVDEKVNIALRDDLLYKELERYVLNNPSNPNHPRRRKHRR